MKWRPCQCGQVVHVALLAAVLFGTERAPATVFRLLTGDYTFINGDWSAYENGRTFETVQSGAPSPPLLSTQHYAGQSSIQIQVPTDNSGAKERFEYVIAMASDADGLHFDNARYCGFAFRLGSPAAAFTSSDLFWQAWQGSPWGPPASLKLTTSAAPPYNIGLYIRNMATGPDSAVPDVKLWSSAMIQPDVWYSVVIYLEPGFTNNSGNIRLWINGTNLVNVTTNIGYDPGLVAGSLTGLDLKNGMYQPDANNGHTMLFDQIVLADNYAEAAVTSLPADTPPTASSGSATTLRNTSIQIDLATITHDSQTASTQCFYTISATNGTASLLPDGHTALLTPTTDFVGTAAYTYTATGEGEDSRELTRYGFEPPDTGTNGYATDNSGHFRDGDLLAVGAGSFSYSTNTPFPPYGRGSLRLLKSGTTNAARLSRYVSNPAEMNFSNRSWTFGGWFQRVATTNHDILLYFGAGDGFGGNGDELQFYCPSGTPSLTLTHYDTNKVLDVNSASAATASASQWHHAALVFQRTNTNAGILRAYLDGVQFVVTNVSWALNQQMPVVFGGHNLANSHLERWFNGWLDDLVIFTNALSAAELTRLASRTVAHFGGLSATNMITLTVTNYMRPVLGNFVVAHGSSSFTVSGNPNANYSIQASSNLVSWMTLQTTNPPTTPFIFVDPSGTSVSSRYYRAIILP